MSETSSYFNCHIDCFGYLNSIRDVPFGKGPSTRAMSRPCDGFSQTNRRTPWFLRGLLRQWVAKRGRITEIFPASYITGGRVVVELRAKLGGMTITGIDELTAVDSQRLNPQETDPIDEQNAASQSPPQAPAPEVVPTPEVLASSAVDPLVDTTPFGVSPDVSSDVSPDKKPEEHNIEAQAADQSLFGLLWPLTNVVKLDATVERRVYRQQCVRLDKLGYGFEALTQDWHLKAA